MNETVLKSRLVAVLRAELPRSVVIRHEDKATPGIPDISVTWYGRTVWLEVKYANPLLRSRGVQDLMMMRLEEAGFAYHVIYSDVRLSRQTVVVSPRIVHKCEWAVKGLTFEGFDHGAVVNFLKNTVFHDRE